jgi:hypothetical protein
LLQSFPAPATIAYVKKATSLNAKNLPLPLSGPFASGTLAVVSLGNPRGKFWGMVLSCAPAGLSLCGVDLASLEDLASMVRQGEPCTPAVVFFPMHRVERMELDLPDGAVPSLAERLLAATGLEAATWFLPPSATERRTIKNAHSKVKARAMGQQP